MRNDLYKHYRLLLLLLLFESALNTLSKSFKTEKTTQKYWLIHRILVSILPGSLAVVDSPFRQAGQRQASTQLR